MASVQPRKLLLSIRSVESVGAFGVVLGVTIGRALLGTVFVVAGIGKIRSGPTRVQAAVLAYDLLPRSLAGPVARWLPHVELATGVLVVAGLALRPAVATAAALLFVFTTVVTLALARGSDAPCGCFGLGDLRPSRRTVVLRNLVLLAIAGALLIWQLPQLALDGALTAAGIDEGLRYALGIAVAAAAASVAAVGALPRPLIQLARESATGGHQR